MPTDTVNFETGPDYIKATSSRDYTPALGMNAPLQIVADKKAPGDVDVIRESLEDFRTKFAEAKAAAGL